MISIGDLHEYFRVRELSLEASVSRPFFRAQLAGLLDHFLGHLLERALVLVYYAKDVEFATVFVTRIPQIVLCLDCLATVRLQRAIENIIVAAERIVVAFGFGDGTALATAWPVFTQVILFFAAVLLLYHAHNALLFVFAHFSRVFVASLAGGASTIDQWALLRRGAVVLAGGLQFLRVVKISHDILLGRLQHRVCFV